MDIYKDEPVCVYLNRSNWSLNWVIFLISRAERGALILLSWPEIIIRLTCTAGGNSRLQNNCSATFLWKLTQHTMLPGNQYLLCNFYLELQFAVQKMTRLVKTILEGDADDRNCVTVPPSPVRCPLGCRIRIYSLLSSPETPFNSRVFCRHGKLAISMIFLFSL